MPVESPVKSATKPHRVPVKSVATAAARGAARHGKNKKERNCR